MTTPVWDFVQAYARRDPARFHMPGHKGAGDLEKWDITEVHGADALFEARGILAESQANAARIFGSGATFYSAEGATLALRAAVALCAAYRPGLPVLALRNAHRSFAATAALLDLPVRYLTPRGADLFSCPLTPAELDEALGEGDWAAVYLTSPDYLGNRPDLAALSAVCRAKRVPLLVDNAHGAYLHFLQPNEHPLALGATLCCDSAHKTLPVLTGGAYLHVSRDAPAFFRENARRFLSLFGSTSPSYLILASLDRCNALLDSSFPEEARRCAARAEEIKKELLSRGWRLTGSEPFKITLLPKFYGYSGTDLADLLREAGMEPEFADPDHLVLMVSPRNRREDGDRLLSFLSALPRRMAKFAAPPPLPDVSELAISPRAALFAPAEEVPAAAALGRILAAPSVACPPAIPIALCGERLTRAHLDLFAYYGVGSVTVIRE